MINRVKGTQDFLDLHLFNRFLHETKKHLLHYQFEEIATPLIEQTELFQRSLGTHTDVVSKEMYYVTTAHENNHELCLRPEITASIVRAFVNEPGLATPWKVFSHGPVFRHERPQKGRYRQFHQVSIEVIGAQAVAQDAYVITMLDRLFSQVLHIREYALLLNFLGCTDDRITFKKAVLSFLSTHESALCAQCVLRKDTNVLRIFDCKQETCQKIYQQAPKTTDHLCHACSQEWKELQDLLLLLSVSFVHQKGLVRGLDYYTKAVFEFSSNHLGAQSAFCGGGRYEHLAKSIGGGLDQPSFGAGIGIERILMLLEQEKHPAFAQQTPALSVIIPMDKKHHALSLLIADMLHAARLSADLIIEESSVKSMFKKANKIGATYALIIGDDEVASRTVTLKNMVTGEQEAVAQHELVARLRK